MQSDVFKFTASVGGSAVAAQTGRGSIASSTAGLSGVTVQLDGSDGNVLATTVTDNSGHYRFNQQSGVSATGDYTVSLVIPAGYSLTSKKPSTIVITRGGVNVNGADFALAKE